MSTKLPTTHSYTGGDLLQGADAEQYVTMRLNGQLFGISVQSVQDVIRYQTIAPIPLSKPVVAGSLNLRGRIVTAFHMRERLSMPAIGDEASGMMIVVDYKHELFALMVDAVGDVLTLHTNSIEKVPSNMDIAWRSVANGVFKLQNELLVILDVGHIIDYLITSEAA